MRNFKTPAWQEAKLSKDLDGKFSFLLAIFFHFWKNTQNMYFFKSEQKKVGNSKNKTKTSESLENCTTFDAGILNLHFFINFLKKIFKCQQKTRKIIWNTLLHPRHQVWHQFEVWHPFWSLWVRGVHWRPVGPHLTPGCPLAPLNLLKVPTEIT